MSFIWFFLYFILSTILLKVASFVGWGLFDVIVDTIDWIRDRSHKKLGA